MRRPHCAHQHPHCLDAGEGGHKSLADQTAGKLVGKEERVDEGRKAGTGVDQVEDIL